MKVMMGLRMTGYTPRPRARLLSRASARARHGGISDPILHGSGPDTPSAAVSAPSIDMAGVWPWWPERERWRLTVHRPPTVTLSSHHDPASLPTIA